MRRWLGSLQIGRWLLRTGIGLVALALVFMNFLAIAPQGRTAVKTALFVVQVLPIPVKPQEWVTASPVREAINFPLPTGVGDADIYRIPDNKKRAGIIVFLGVNPAPRDDDRVVNLGEGLARAGFVVMIPWSPHMIEDERIDASEPDNLVRAFQYLRGLKYVDPTKVGMGGFCVGASLAIVAASDPRISEDVNFVSSFGAYYDMRDLLTQISSKQSFYRETEETWDPRGATERVFTNQLIEGLELSEERELLSRIFVDKSTVGDGELDGLTTGASAVHRLLASLHAQEDGQRLTLEEAQRLVQGLPSDFQQELDMISPSTNINNLKARLLIAHDREDDAVPSEESRRLADALSQRGDIHYTEFSFFSHVTPDKPVGPFTFVKEAFKLFQYAYSIVRRTT